MSKAVLIVEDDNDLLDAMELLLSGSGYRVMTAHEGREALERVAREMPGVILLDMRMPGMNGWDFAREYRRLYGRSAAPIVMVTAAEDVEKRAEEIEADDYLGKPFDIADVLKTVQKYMAP